MFSIGYRLADAEGPGRLDNSYYDLLASEARLASFFAIAKGDVPQEQWFHLGRMLVGIDESVRSNYFPYGFSGMMVGAALVFFAFIGFDSISTQAEEAKKPFSTPES